MSRRPAFSRCTEVWQFTRTPTRQHVAHKRSSPGVKKWHPQKPFVPLASSNPRGHHFPDFWHRGLVLSVFDLKPPSLFYLFFFVCERPLSHVQQFVVVAVGIPLYVTSRFIYGHLGRVQLGVTNTPSVALSSTGRRLRRGRRCRVTGARGLGLADAPRGL